RQAGRDARRFLRREGVRLHHLASRPASAGRQGARRLSRRQRTRQIQVSRTNRDRRRFSVDPRRQGRQACAQGSDRVADAAGSRIERASRCEESVSMISTEHIIATRPLVIRRRVKWGDCDPAGVVYTVTFAEYVVSAAELFYGSLFETTPQRAKDLH